MTPGDWFIERIEEYLDDDGALSESERLEMERRIASDPACHAEIEEARRFRELATRARPLPIPAELGDRIRARLATTEPRTTEPAAPPDRGGRVVLLRRLVTLAVAATILFLLVNPHGLRDPGAPQAPLDPAPAPVAAAPEVTDRVALPDLTARVLADWLDQARNVAPDDAARLLLEARECDLLSRVRSRLAFARGVDRSYLLAAEDLLIQIENGISPEALPREAGLVALARN